jgi:DNA-binding IclR family transcriptional regulator
VQVLHKTIDILDALRHAPDGMSLAGLAAQSKMPKPTVYRILATLESRGYLERAADSSYRISRKLFEEPRDSVLQVAARGPPRPEKLAALCKETVNLGARWGESWSSRRWKASKRSHDFQDDNRRYPHSTGLGKSFFRPAERAVLRSSFKGIPNSLATIVREKDLIVEERTDSHAGLRDGQHGERPDGRCIAPGREQAKKVSRR